MSLVVCVGSIGSIGARRLSLGVRSRSAPSRTGLAHGVDWLARGAWGSIAYSVDSVAGSVAWSV
jgi:hypothetical protein